MSPAAWSAVGCAVAGAMVGAVLPSVSDKWACGSVTLGPPRRSMTVRRTLAVVGTSATMCVLGWRYPNPTLVAWCWLTITGVCLVLVDFGCQRLPRPLVVAMAGGGLTTFLVLAIVETSYRSLLTALIAATGTLVLALMLGLAVPQHIGGGDVTLLPVLALYLGWHGWHTLATGLVAGATLTGCYAAALVVLGRAKRGSRVPAGPPLIVGTLIAIAVSAAPGL